MGYVERPMHEEPLRCDGTMNERRQANEDLEAKLAQLGRVNADLADFTHLVSHELKEPLRGIGAYCRILMEDCCEQLDEDGRRRLLTLGKMSQRLERLIDDLLNYSRMGRRSPERRHVDLTRVVADSLETLEASIHQRGAMVRVVRPLPIVAADETMLGEVFRNLISNAIKFSDAPSPQVEIGCLDGACPTLYVRDWGIGIAPEHHEVVFDMFRRLHSRDRFEGSGAGLAIVRRIVEAHGGRVWIDSALGQGTTVYFTLASAGAVAPPHAGRTTNAATSVS